MSLFPEGTTYIEAREPVPHLLEAGRVVAATFDCYSAKGGKLLGSVHYPFPGDPYYSTWADVKEFARKFNAGIYRLA